MPAANNRNNNDSVDEEDIIPTLIGRFEAFDSDSDDEDDGAASSTNNPNGAGAAADDDNEDLPELMLRPDAGSSTGSGGNDEDDDEDSVPPLEVPRRTGGSDEEDTDDSNEDEDEDEEQNEDDDSIPDLVDRDQDNYDSSNDSQGSELEDQRQGSVPAQPTPQRARAAQYQQQRQQRGTQQQQHQQQEQYPYQEQAIRVSYWVNLIETATAMSVGDLKAAVRNMDSSTSQIVLEKSELVVEYAKLKSRQVPVPRPPGCVRETLTPERSQRWQELQQRLNPGRMDDKDLRQMLQTEFKVTLRPEWNTQELQDLYLHLHLQREDQAWRNTNTTTTPKIPLQQQVQDVQRQMPAFRLRGSLRQEFGRSTLFLHSHRQLARAYVYAKREKNAVKPIPTAMPAQNRSTRGTWILAAPTTHHEHQQQWELTYAWTNGTTIVKSPDAYTSLNPDAGDQLVPGSTPGSVWVYYRCCHGTKEGKEQQPTTFAIDLVRCELSTLRIPMYQNLPRATQLVTTGQNGLWMLVQSSDDDINTKTNKINNSELAQLVLYDRDHRHGHFTSFDVHHRTTRLFPDVAQGGVWLWVRDPTTTGFSSPGLWYVSTTGARYGPAVLLGSKKEEESQKKNGVIATSTAIAGASWLLASDSTRRGLWLLGPAGTGGDSGRLVHVTATGDTKDGWNLVVRQQLVDAQLDQVQSILDDGTTPEGALLHCKTKSEWKLMRAVLGRSELVEQYKCTKNAKIATTGTAAPGVWVLKKTGRRGLQWGLQYLHPTETVEELTEKYAANSILCGGIVVGTTASSGSL